MIFERITLQNFQRYRGESTITFPASGNGHQGGIVLVLAPNNAGKTTILRARRFLFYGHLAGFDRDTSWNLANDLVRADAPVGQNLEVSVEARVSICGDAPITIRRTLVIRKTAADRWHCEGPYLFSKQTARPKEEFQVDGDGTVQSLIDTAVPQDLFSWFYFAGEPAEGKMSHGNSRALMEPLKKAIQIRRWADAIHTATEVYSNLKSRLQREARNHGEYSALLQKKDVVTRGRSENIVGLASAEREVHDLERAFAEVDGECLRTSKRAEESQRLYQRLKDQRASPESEHLRLRQDPRSWCQRAP